MVIKGVYHTGAPFSVMDTASLQTFRKEGQYRAF